MIFFNIPLLCKWEFVYKKLFILKGKKPIIILISVLDLISGSEIEDFTAALKTQNIMPEMTLEENIKSIPLHNGAIKISLENGVSDIFSSFILYINKIF